MLRLSHVRRMLALCVAVTIASTAGAQNIPDWYNETSRGQSYPENGYYTGMAYAEVTSSEGTAIRQAEQEAKAEALSTILMSVKSRSVSSSVSTAITTGNGIDEQIVEQYASLTQIDVVFKEVPGLQCQHYRNGNTVVAFAYVKKADLARYYDRKITATLTKIETALDNADELVRHGEKIKARAAAQSAVQSLAELENAQRILLAVANDADIRSTEASALAKRLVTLLAGLKHSTAIYLDCQATLQGKPYPPFGEQIKGTLSKLGVNFVNDRSQADWVITVKAKEVRENTLSGAHFAWIDGDVTVCKKATRQTVYSNTISAMEPGHPDGIKGGHSSGYGQAVKAAYKEAARIVETKLSEIIKN